MNLSDLRRNYLSICAGFHKSKYQNRDIYFKHLGEVEQAEIDEIEQSHLERLLKIGTPNYEECLKKAIDEGRWSQEKERGIKNNIATTENFFRKRPKTTNVEKIDAWFEAYGEMKENIQLDKQEKGLAIGETAEFSASMEAYFYEIFLCSYSDSKLQNRFFELDEFEDLSEIENAVLYSLYSDVKSLLIDELKTIKQIACQNFFLTRFSLGTAAEFFKKSLFDLSNNQMLLAAFGKRYAEIIPYCHGAPERFYECPEKLECYAAGMQEGGRQETESSDAMHNEIIKARGGR